MNAIAFIPLGHSTSNEKNTLVSKLARVLTHPFKKSPPYQVVFFETQTLARMLTTTPHAPNACTVQAGLMLYIMDTLDKLFQLQQSLSNDLTNIAKQQRKALSREEKAKLEFKYETLWQVYQQVCDLVLPY